METVMIPDPAIKPGATEIWYDGVDQNCNGDDDFDQDGDGETAAGYAVPIVMIHLCLKQPNRLVR